MKNVVASAIVSAIALTSMVAGPASAAEKIKFGTDWVAEAEHGGFYQAVADGTYARCGLDVTIVPGGPQVNNRALMLAGKLQFHMGGDMLQAFSAVQEGIPIVFVAAAFQKHPQAFLTHPGAAETWEDLKDLKLLVGDHSYQSFYQWMIKEFGFSAEKRLPYTFNPAPFLVDKNIGMQGFISSEPYLVEKQGGFKPKLFLLADAGYSTYAETIETMADTIKNKPEVVKCFVEGSIKGWYNYLYNDGSAANELIKKDNPDMTDELIAFAVAKMKEYGIVDSGDTEALGIGVITEKKVKGFFDKMVAAGVVDADVDWRASFTTQFVGKGVGLDLKK